MARLENFVNKLLGGSMEARLHQPKHSTRAVVNTISICAFSMLLFACQPSKPTNLEDCLLTELKGVTSDQAANAIKAACAKKFRSAEPQQTPLTKEQLKRVSGELRPKWGNIVEGQFHNGNSDLLLYTVTVNVTAYELKTRKVLWSAEYDTPLYARPLHTSYVTIHAAQSLEGLGFDWNLVRAVGIPPQ